MAKRTKVTKNNMAGKSTFLDKKEPVAVKDNAKVTITMSIDQAYFVIHALELHARLHIGQFEHLDWEFLSHGKDRDFWRDEEQRDQLRAHLLGARNIIFPELNKMGFGGSYGIFNQLNIGETAHVAWDMYQCVRYQLAYYRNPNPDMVHEWSVSYNRPMRSSEIHEMPTVELFKDGKNISKPVVYL
jgi:hypothetical protein